MLRDQFGATVSLHRYFGRWIVLRVTESPDLDLLDRLFGDIDGVAVNVVVDSQSLLDAHRGAGQSCSCMVDGDGTFLRWFPGLEWPATFVIDPAGKLVAILTDESCEPFARALVNTSGSGSSFGAIDLGEIGA